MKKEDVTATKYYNSFAPEYEDLAEKYHWLSPGLLFGVLFKHLTSEGKLLDIGIGTGLSSEPFFKSGMKIYGVDGSKEMLEICESKKIAEELTLLDLEIDKLPYGNDSFDFVISNGVCYFIKNIDHYIYEALRVLKPGGHLIFNFESVEKNLYAAYSNHSNSEISSNAELKDKTGVTVYKYNIDFLIQKMKSNFNIAEITRARYYAYTSPSIKKDVYFTLLLIRKN